MGRERTSYPRFKRAGGAPAIRLTEDDLAILRHVHRHRFVRADDLYRLFPERSADKLSRRLTWLFRSEYLDRPAAQIDRFRQGGSQALVYGLGNAGARTLKEQGLPIGPTDWRARNRSYTRENLDHTLAVASFMVDLELSCWARPDVSLIPFEEIVAGAPEATRASPLPMRWAVPVDWLGYKADVHLIPDAIFGLKVERSGEPVRRSYVFLEVDRGTMTIAPTERVRRSDAFLYRATILRKFLAYAQSYREGLHRRQFGIPAARVLFLTTSQARADSMRRAAEGFVVSPQRLPGGLFLFGVHSGDDNSAISATSDGLGRSTSLIP